MNPNISKNDDDIHARNGEVNIHSSQSSGFINIMITNQTIVPIEKHLAKCAEIKSATVSITPKPVLVDGG